MLETALLALGWIGAGVAALLAAAVLLRGREEGWTGAGFAVAAVASGLVTASHTGLAGPALEAAEVVATLAAGPLVAGWAAAGARVAIPSWARAIAFAPAAGWALAALAGSKIAGDRRAIRWAVVLQIAWTVAAALIVWVRRARLGAIDRRALALGLGGLGCLHFAQLVRLIDPDRSPKNLVPATMGALLVGLAVVAVQRTRLSFAVGPRSKPHDADAASILAELDRWLVGAGAMRERGLTVAAAAKRLGVSPAGLSRALNRHAGRSFAEHLARLRVAEAERLLRDPALAHLSVEAIGTRSGFGSRSGFFADFRRATGSSPADYRARSLPGSS